MRSVVLVGLSCRRLACTRSPNVKQWIGTRVSRLVLIEEPPNSKDRHFSMLARGWCRPRSRCLSNACRDGIQHERDRTNICLPMFQTVMRGYKVRSFQRKMFKDERFNVLMPGFPFAVIPSLANILSPRIQGAKNKIVSSIDKDFDFEDFLLNAKKGTLTVANILLSRKETELKDLFTPEAYRLILLNHNKLEAIHKSVLHTFCQEKPWDCFQFHDTEVDVEVSKHVPEVTVKINLMVSIFLVSKEKKTRTEVVVNTAGFERVYTAKLNDSTWSKWKEFDMNRIKQSDLTALDFKSDDYWHINGITFSLMPVHKFQFIFV